MTDHQPEQKRNVWDQWDWVWHVSAYAFLGLNIVFTLRLSASTDPLPLFLGLAALLALWYLPFVATSAFSWWYTPRRGVLYFILGWVLWGGLLSLNGGSLMLAGMFYPLIFIRFPIRWAVGIAVSQTLGLYLLFMILHPTENWFIILLIVLGLLAAATLLGAFISSLIDQSVERQRLLDELIQTRTDLLKAERQAGVLAERHRMSREIHDTLAQQFTSIIMHLAAARLNDAENIQPRLQQAEETAREGLDETRRIIWNLRPEQLEHASLVESIEGLAVRWSVENAVHVNTAVTGTPRLLESAFENSLLRITQEALHNIQKHAQAQAVNVTLSYMPDLIALDVMDDGLGFDILQDGGGFGLQSMRERAEEIGGTLTIESEPGKGTAIGVSIPVLEAA